MARDVELDVQPMNLNDLNHPQVLVVDMINGFAKEGALADPAIAGITPAIQKVMDQLETKGIFLCDAHPEDAREFDYFPKHCIQGTEESEVLEELKPYIKKRVEKNSINSFFAPDFQQLLPELVDRDLIVTGCCSDLCVLQLALSLQSYLSQINSKGRVIVPLDCVETFESDVHPAGKNNQAALENMMANGIQVVSTLEAL